MKMHGKVHEDTVSFLENGRITRHLSCVHDEMRDVFSAAVPRNNFSFCFLGGVLKACKIVGRCCFGSRNVITV
jgi:hypothetical protein